MLGETHILVFALGVTQILVFLDTKLLVSPMRNSRVGGLDQRKVPTRKICVAVEYRLKSSSYLAICISFFHNFDEWLLHGCILFAVNLETTTKCEVLKKIT